MRNILENQYGNKLDENLKNKFFRGGSEKSFYELWERFWKANMEINLDVLKKYKISAPVYFFINVFRENEVLLANANMEINWLQK